MRSDRTRVSRPATLLQRISIELGRRCNLRCCYCYADSSAERGTGLTDPEVRAVIAEAVAAGACLVSIVGGGEPLLRPTLLADGVSCIDYAGSLGCYCVLYTNGTLLDAAGAAWLAARDVSVVAKLNSLDDATQDQLTGVVGSAVGIRGGIEALLRAGLSDGDPSRLGLETIVCRQNYDELPELWRWMRQRNIVPEVEIPTIHGRAEQNRDLLYFSDDEAPGRYRELFEELLAIDRAEFGFDWEVHPPFPAASCQLYYTNCYVNERGGVQPCAGVDREYGVLRVGDRGAQGIALGDILRSEPFRALRHIHEHLGPPCQGCELLGLCYGCRGAAYHLTGDLYAGDPVCWRGSRPRRP